MVHNLYCMRDKENCFISLQLLKAVLEHYSPTDQDVLSVCLCVLGCDLWSQITYMLVPLKKKEELQKTSYLQRSLKTTELSAAVPCASVLILFSKTKLLISHSNQTTLFQHVSCFIPDCAFLQDLYFERTAENSLCILYLSLDYTSGSAWKLWDILHAPLLRLSKTFKICHVMIFWVELNQIM